MNTYIKRTIVLLLFTTILGYSQEKKTLIIASGSRGGNYYKTAKQISQLYKLQFKKFNFSIIETNGSIENIELLKNNVVDFALIQRNVLINNLYDENKGTKNISVISPLFQEKLWMYFKGNKPINLNRINQEISPEKIKIGFTSKNGFSFKTFKKLIKFLNVDNTKFVFVENNYQTLLEKFNNNQIDILVSFSLPIQEIDTLNNVQKIYLTKQQAKLIEDRLHNLTLTPISKEKQYSLGSWSFLVGSKKSIQHIEDEEKLLTTLVQNNRINSHSIISQSYTQFIKNKNNELSQLRNLPLSKGLKKITIFNHLNWQPYLLSFVFLLLLISIHYYIKGKWVRSINIFYLWERYKHFQLGFVFLVLLYFASIELLIYSEKIFYEDIGLKSQLLNLSRKDLHSWLLVTTVTGNSNGVFPYSLVGKAMLALNSLNFWIGTLLIGVSEYFTFQMNKKRKLGIMKTNSTNHIVIFGWNSHTQSFIQETLNDAKKYNNQKIKIVCVVKDITFIRSKYKTVQKLHDQKKIDIIQGDALDTHILEISKVHLANTVILLSEENSKLSDERTVMRAHAVSRFTKRKKNLNIPPKKQKIKIIPSKNKKIVTHKQYKIENTADNIYIIAELNGEEFKESLMDAEVNEVIITGNYSKAILKQSMFNHGISTVLDEIMQYNDYNEFYKIDLSLPKNKHLVGLTFDKLLIDLRSQGILLIAIHIIFHDENNNIIIDKGKIKQLLTDEENGLERDIIVNPTSPYELNRPVDQDDHLIVLATNKRKLSQGIKNLKLK